MKKSLSNIVLPILLLCLTPITTLAEEVEIDGIKYTLVNKAKQATVIRKDTQYSGDIVIPSTIEYEGIEYSVTSIGANVFNNCSYLTSISIPNNVTSIGYYAFWGCEALTSVHITDLVAWCNISFDEFSNPLFYAHHLYLNDKEIKDLIIPISVTSIRDYVFSGCSNFTSITIPNNVTNIGESAFLGCSKLTSVTIPDNVARIGDYAFSGCSGLASITIPNSVISIGERVFYGCNSLTTIIIPNSMTSIGEQVFYNCTGLTNVTIPNSVTSIGKSAFSSCSKLTSVTIPDNVTRIGDDAFWGCSKLTSVIIGNGIRTIKAKAFFNCSDLETFTIHATSVPTTETNVFDSSYIDYATLYVPDESIDVYRSTAPWSNFGTIKGISGTIVEKEKCATPTIHYTDGKLTFECETEGATCYPTVTKPEVVNVSNNEMQLGTTYKVSVYAAKPGYEDSDVATAEINMAQGSMGSKFDVNNDGEINITDALIIINFILGRYYNIP